MSREHKVHDGEVTIQPLHNGLGGWLPTPTSQYSPQPCYAPPDKVLRVFKKDKAKGSKRVDITLATDMLLHVSRKHYDIAVLVAGDEDYVPLVRAVQGEGARVHVWFLPDGLSPALQFAADSYLDLDQFLL